jgi:hypothetical protein
MLEALLGPIGGLLAGIVAVVLALVLGNARGASRAKSERAAQDAADYRDTRKEIDNADMGIGASDANRIDRLRAIADRRGAGKD